MTIIRTATCRCGQLSVECRGVPTRVSVCHCLNCQKRSGSVFSAQARFADTDVTVSGTSKGWEHVGESGNLAVFNFCPDCGSTVFYKAGPFPDQTAVAIGAFADPAFPAPTVSVFENRKHDWVEVVGDGIVHD